MDQIKKRALREAVSHGSQILFAVQEALKVESIEKLQQLETLVKQLKEDTQTFVCESGQVLLQPVSQLTDASIYVDAFEHLKEAISEPVSKSDQALLQSMKKLIDTVVLLMEELIQGVQKLCNQRKRNALHLDALTLSAHPSKLVTANFTNLTENDASEAMSESSALSENNASAQSHWSEDSDSSDDEQEDSQHDTRRDSGIAFR